MDITMALTAVRGALDVARGALDARDDARVKAALSDMAGRLFDANLAALSVADRAQSLASKLADAAAELRELKDRQAEIEKYVLKECAHGCFVYAPKPSTVALEGRTIPRHYLCQNCFDRGIKSVLRLEPDAVTGDYLICAENDRHMVRVDNYADL